MAFGWYEVLTKVVFPSLRFLVEAIVMVLIMSSEQNEIMK